jgi:branched-chain amino acid transport system substrate-binding protein
MLSRALLLVALVVACTAEPATITIGAAGPWTEGYGAMNKRGIDLAVSEINAAGGVRGRPLRVIDVDDAGDGARAAAIAEQFVSDPSISAVIGHVSSGAMVAAAKVYDGRLAAVATTATSPDLTGISPWVFRVVGSDSTTGALLAQFTRRIDASRVAILYENDSYGRGLADAFRRNFDGRIIGADPIPRGGTTDFEPYVAYLVQRRPDLVFVAGTEASGMALLREARRQRLTADFLGGDGWTGVVNEPAAQGAFVGSPFTASDPRPEVRRFVDAFRARYSMLPDGNAALAYDATRLVARVIEEVGTDRGAVRDRLASLDDKSAHLGVTGAIRFRDTGDRVSSPMVIARVDAGDLVVTVGR